MTRGKYPSPNIHSSPFLLSTVKVFLNMNTRKTVAPSTVVVSHRARRMLVSALEMQVYASCA